MTPEAILATAPISTIIILKFLRPQNPGSVMLLEITGKKKPPTNQRSDISMSFVIHVQETIRIRMYYSKNIKFYQQFIETLF